MKQDELDAWAGQVPGLIRDAEGRWSAGGADAVSFPEGAHADLAAVEDGSYWFTHRSRIINEVVRAFPPTGTIFDVGGGNGYVSRALQGAGFDCVVVEPGAIGATVSRQRGLATIQAPFESLSVPPGSLPAVGLFDVLEHIEYADAVLASLARAIPADGMLYITVPAYNWLWSEEDAYGGHFRRYTLSRLNASVRAAGFEPLYSTYLFSILVPAIFLARTVPSFLRLRSASDRQRVAREHSGPGGVFKRTFDRVGAWEQQRVRSGRVVPFGTSCLVAARRR